jgi:predicted nucleic acid-binding protein
MPLGPALPETSLVLDNDVFSHLRNGQPYAEKAVGDYFIRLKRVPALAAIGLFESLSGIENAEVKGKTTSERGQKYRNRVEELCQIHEVLPFNQAAAKIAAQIFPRLSQKERKGHLNDLFIAATALAHGYGVATGNQKDFALIARHLPVNLVLRLAIWKP